MVALLVSCTLGILCYQLLAKTLIVSGEAKRLSVWAADGREITGEDTQSVVVHTDGTVANDAKAWTGELEPSFLLDLVVKAAESPQVRGGWVYVSAPARLESGIASGWTLARGSIATTLLQAASLTAGGTLLLWAVLVAMLHFFYRSMRNAAGSYAGAISSELAVEDVRLESDFIEILEGSKEVVRRKFHEMGLRIEELNQLASIAKGTGNGVFVCNENGKIEWVNQGLSEMIQRSSSEVVGRSPVDCLKLGYNDPVQMAALSGALRLGNSIQLEVFLDRGDGVPLMSASLELQPIGQAGDTAKGFFGVVIDISEEKNATEKLEEVSRRFTLAMESANIGVWEWNVKHDHLTWDERMYSLYGIHASDFEGTFGSWMNHIDPDYRNRTTRIVDQSLEEKTNLQLVTRMRRADGQEIYVKHVGRAFRNENGDVMRYLGIALDVTTQYLAERDLTEQKDEAENLAIRLADAVKQSKKAAAEAYQATRAKSAFLAMMSHEIRTPMNGVIGMASLLLETELDEYQRDYLNTIRTSGDTLLTLINDILDYSKIESGKLDIERAPFQLRECVEDSLDLLASKAAEKNLELICKFDLNTPETILGDTTRLKQILVNLVGNAIKFTEYGEVEVSVHAPLEGHLKFSVRDTGIGIAKDRMHRLFEVFSQVDSSTTRKYGGSGLGLSISKQLTELMGGEMWVESSVGKGSIFSFTIEVPELESLSPDPLFLKQEDLVDQRVLIVEPCFVLRDYIRSLCAAWGMKPTAVSSIDDLANLNSRDESFRVTICGEGEVKSDVVVRLLRHGTPIKKESGVCSVYKPCHVGGLLEAIRMGIGSPKKGRTNEIVESAELSEAYAQRLPLRILVADDNSVNQKVARMMLKKFGYGCDVVANGVEAVEAVKQRDYDLVFMDCQMPEMDGFEATRMIRDLESDRAGSKVAYIFALTANVREESLDRSKKVGMNGFLAKPIKLGDIQQALDEVATAFAERN